MREIKFRAWDKDKKKMWYPDGICLQNKYEALAMTFGFCWQTCTNDILMQYTGLLDKNGKEIYESDLIKTPAGIGTIIWDKCYWIDWEKNGRTTLYDTKAEQMEIVGNEFE